MSATLKICLAAVGTVILGMVASFGMGYNAGWRAGKATETKTFQAKALKAGDLTVSIFDMSPQEMTALMGLRMDDARKMFGPPEKIIGGTWTWTAPGKKGRWLQFNEAGFCIAFDEVREVVQGKGL